MSSQQMIQVQLQTLPSRFKLRLDKGSAWICCPFHKGNTGGLENTPSMRINLVQGKFDLGSARCFACAKTFDTWNDLAAELSLSQVESYVDEPYDVVSEDEARTMLGQDNSTGLDMRSMEPWPKDKDWRTIRGKLINAVDGHVYYSYGLKEHRLYLPAWVLGNHVGGIRCVIEPKSGEKKYLNTKGSWAKSYFYGFDYAAAMLNQRKLKTLLVVEGPRDALNMLQHGIPAVAMLGTGNWSDNKRNLLMGLDLDLVIIATDPDAAGRKAAKQIKESVQEFIEVKRFKLDATIDEDPGNLRPERIKRLKEYIR
jgi:5S rRNA maturation endonuclease (ribonuclease M5)